MQLPGTFELTYPCWALIHKDSVVWDPNGNPVNVTVPVKTLLLDDTSGGAMFPLFTDADLAERFKSASGGYDDYVVYPLISRKIVLDALRCARGDAGADTVTIDKPQFRGRPYAIWPIGYAMQRIEAGERL